MICRWMPRRSPRSPRARDAVRRGFALALIALGCGTTPPAGPAQREPLPPGVRFESPAGFSLLPVSDWSRLPSSAVGDGSSALALFDERTGSLVLFYVYGATTATIDGLVANRRSELARNGTVLGFEEERRFSPRAPFVPVSTARYGVQSEGSRRDFIVVTAHGAERVVEAVALTPNRSASRQRVEALLETLVP